MLLSRVDAPLWRGSLVPAMGASTQSSTREMGSGAHGRRGGFTASWETFLTIEGSVMTPRRDPRTDPHTRLAAQHHATSRRPAHDGSRQPTGSPSGSGVTGKETIAFVLAIVLVVVLMVVLF
jgi:hypothetical protein